MISILRIFKYFNKPSHIHIRLLSSGLSMENEDSDRIWSQVLMKNKKDGSLIKLRVQAVPKDRFEDFIDLKINHFVKDDILHRVSGVNDNLEAVKDCREVLSEMMKKPSVHKHVYFIDDESKPKPELIGASIMKLVTKDYVYEETKVKTKEMKRYFEIDHAWNQLFPYDEVFKQYGVDCFFQDIALFVHAKYRLLGIAKYDALVRRLVCQAHGVAVTGAWCTMLGSQRACEIDNWDTLFEMSYDELESRLGIQFKDPTPPSCKYMALKVF